MYQYRVILMELLLVGYLTIVSSLLIQIISYILHFFPIVRQVFVPLHFRTDAIINFSGKDATKSVKKINISL